MLNFITRIYKKPMLFLVDLILLNIAFALSFILRFDSEWLLYLEYTNLIVFSAISAAVLLYSGLYNKIWRYASISELNTIIKNFMLINLLFMAYLVFFKGSFPRSILIINGILDVFMVGGFRFFLRFLREYLINKQMKDVRARVLIIGAGDAAEMIIREMQKHPELGKEIIGLIDDDPDKSSLEIHGKKVLGDRHLIPEIINKHKVTEVIIAIPSAEGKIIKELYNLSNQEGVQVQIVPGIYEIINGDVNLNMIREVKVEDLLRRDSVDLKTAEIAAYVAGKTVLVTGGGGSIGSELSRQIARFNPDRLVLFDIYENDMYFLELELREEYPDLDVISIIGSVRDKHKLSYVFAQYEPEVVFHAAAHKHVPLMEYNPEEAVKNNILGTRNLTETADAYDVERFVLISTDKAVNPTNVMGASKRVAEMIIHVMDRHSRTKFMAVRFGNVLGSHGSVIPLFKKKIANREPLTVTHPEVKRYFMTIPEAAQLVIQAGALGRGGEVFVLDMGEPVRILDLAKDLIKLSGLKPGEDIDIEITGLRPGEKLYEELLHSGENIATEHEKIFITKLKIVDETVLYKALDRLEKLASIEARDEIIKTLVKIVGTYKPNRDNVQKVMYYKKHENLYKKRRTSEVEEEVATATEE